MIQSLGSNVSDEVKKLQEKVCMLEASKDSEMLNQVECHDLEVTNRNTIQQLQEDIGLLKVGHSSYFITPCNCN